MENTNDSFIKEAAQFDKIKIEEPEYTTPCRCGKSTGISIFKSRDTYVRASVEDPLAQKPIHIYIMKCDTCGYEPTAFGKVNFEEKNLWNHWDWFNKDWEFDNQQLMAELVLSKEN